MAFSPLARRRPESMTGRVSLLSTLVLGTLAVASFAVPAADASETSRLQVQAQASVEVDPDKATVSARLWEDTPAVDLSEKDQREKHEKARKEARDALEKRAANLVDALEDNTDIKREAISAGSLSVSPQRSAPANAQGDDEQKTLTRTRLERPVSIKLDDLDKVEDVLNALMESGVNRLDGVTFDLKDRDAATEKALVKALEKARQKAALMADTLDVELGRLMYVEETRSPSFAPRMMSISADAQGKAESSAVQPEYRPGTIDIDAGVNVKWALEDGADGASDDADSAKDANVSKDAKGQ
ncbi:MAG: SIMPL domain-containing protein [Halomonas subglaciescola]|nr:SIMPL domain-containing protein [Halomonas subglaciescola]